MRTYLILKDKAERWNNHEEIAAILSEIESTNGGGGFGEFSTDHAAHLLIREFDRGRIASKGLKYERLDQLTMDVLFGVE
jgi:xylose isomerase